jgi:Cutinase
MMARTSRTRRKRHRILAVTAAAAVAVLVALIVGIVVVFIRWPDSPPSALPPTAVPPTSTPGQTKPRPAFQDASCPDTQLLILPGTWESWPTDDPLNPTQFPASLLRRVADPIRQEFGADRVQVYTLPYTAQFHNPLSDDGQMSYDDSREEGSRTAVRVLTEMNERCPLSSYVLVGFSQGAVIAGDIASDIGNGRGPVDADLVRGVMLIADGRRQTGSGQEIGPNPPGQGAEITLHEVPVLSALGLTMTGPRPGGFGLLNDRTYQICAKGDLICSAPSEAFNIANLPATLGVLVNGAAGPVHAMYGTPDFWNLGGQTATDWALAWTRTLLDDAPHPPHG